MTEAIRAERKGAVYAITLNRPEAGNAVSDSMIVQLGDFLEAVDSTVRVITIQGPRAFSGRGARHLALADRCARIQEIFPRQAA